MAGHQNGGASLPFPVAGVYPEDPRCAKWWWMARILHSPSPTLPAESQLLQTECFTLFLGLNFFRLELNQVGRKFWGTRARAVVFLSKFNYNFKAEPRGLGTELGWQSLLVQRAGGSGLCPQDCKKQTWWPMPVIPVLGDRIRWIRKVRLFLTI